MVFGQSRKARFIGQKSTHTITHWRFFARWENGGNTPTKNMRNRINYALRKDVVEIFFTKTKARLPSYRASRTSLSRPLVVSSCPDKIASRSRSRRLKSPRAPLRRRSHRPAGDHRAASYASKYDSPWPRPFRASRRSWDKAVIPIARKVWLPIFVAMPAASRRLLALPQG